MKNKYLGFLCGLVGKSYEYSNLLEYLHGMEFYSLVPNDDNRASDGRHIRDLFNDKVGPQGSSSLPNCDCTVLEMLIGVAYRLEFDLLGGKYERPMADWFWVLIDNLELSWYDNVLFGHSEIIGEVAERVRTLLERSYSENGDGGLFPLKFPKVSQKEVEIWYQMSAWVIENYPI